MTSQLNFAVSQAHQQDLRRHAADARRAGDVPTRSRIGRIRFSLPQLQVARRIAAVRATIASA